MFVVSVHSFISVHAGYAKDNEETSLLARLVVPQGFLEVGEVPVLMRVGNSTHELHVPHGCVLECELDGKEQIDVFRLGERRTLAHSIR